MEQLQEVFRGFQDRHRGVARAEEVIRGDLREPPPPPLSGWTFPGNGTVHVDVVENSQAEVIGSLYPTLIKNNRDRRDARRNRRERSSKLCCAQRSLIQPSPVRFCSGGGELQPMKCSLRRWSLRQMDGAGRSVSPDDHQRDQLSGYLSPSSVRLRLLPLDRAILRRRQRRLKSDRSFTSNKTSFLLSCGSPPQPALCGQPMPVCHVALTRYVPFGSNSNGTTFKGALVGGGGSAILFMAEVIAIVRAQALRGRVRRKYEAGNYDRDS